MKKRPVLLLALCLSLLCLHAADAGATLVKISDSVYSYVDIKEPAAQNSFGANSGIIIGKEFIVAVDSLISAKEAKRFIKDIQKVSKKPVKFLINTHYHLDHSLGNSEFAKLGAVIISQENDRQNQEKAGAGMMEYARKSGLTDGDLKGTKTTFPILTFKERLTLDLGNNLVEVVFPGPSHTSGSVLVHVPREKVMFAGDILFTDRHPFLGNADIPGWVKVLDAMTAMDVEKIIPGHGPVSTKKDLADLKAYLLIFDQKAKELTAQSQDLGYIVAEMKKALPPRSRFEALIARNITMKYLRQEKEQSPPKAQ